MFTVTITYLLDGFPEKTKFENVTQIKTTYDKTLLTLNEIEEVVVYYVTKVKCKLQMES